ncbi:hypothetical protein BGX27_008759 [Mortierella sp. AM989]|nr:hypothetical protein BGX27_008759 [Mortierella sp. AM989]
MSKDKGKSNALPVGITTRTTRGRSTKKTSEKGKSKDMSDGADTADAESLAIIQEKVSKFQPKIDSLLPRMLGKSSTTTNTPAEPTSVEQGPSNSGNKSKSVKPTVSPTVATTKGATIESISSKTKDKPPTVTAKKSATAAGSSLKSKPKKSPGPTGTSITALIPKGSRARPLPKKMQESDRQDTFGGSSYATRAGDQAEDVIVLSSSLTSTSWDDDHYGGNHGDDSGDDIEEIEIGPEKARTIKTIKADDLNAKPGAAINKAAPISAKLPSTISVGSAASVDYASVNPSVQADRITDWMGGVKEAMEQDKEDEALNSTLPPVAVAVVPTTSAAENKNSATTSRKPAETKSRTEARKPILRRPPPGIPRHTASTTTASPSPRLDEPTASPVVILSSLGEDGSSLAASVKDKRSYKGKNVLIQDSIASVPCSQEISESSGSYAKSSVEISSSPSPPHSPSDKASVTAGTSSKLGFTDEVSTVEEQPTQDSIGGLQSLPSFVYESGKNVSKEEEDYYARVRQEFKEPSLPSALTSSCLQELGLLKRKSSRDERELRKRRSRRGLSVADEDEEENEEESVILAQMEAFPSSIGAAPASSSSPSLGSAPSSSVLKAPEYTHALPDRMRKVNGTEGQDQSQGNSQAQTQDLNPEEDWSTKQKSWQQPKRDSQVGPQGASFPSPPTQVTFSTLPTMPSFPSQLHSEPSLILLGSQNPNQTHKNDDES